MQPQFYNYICSPNVIIEKFLKNFRNSWMFFDSKRLVHDHFPDQNLYTNFTSI